MNEQTQTMTYYDRQLANLNDVPDVTKVKPYTVRVVPPLGIGGALLFVVQTLKHRERGDYVFLEIVEGAGATRVVLTPEVTAAIARQRDALSKRARSKAARQVAEDRRARGLKPGFTRRKV